MKADPSPGMLDAVSWPAMAWARARASGRPMPVPSIPVCSAPSRSNGTKIRSRSAARIPGPVSATTRLTWLVRLRLAGDRDGAAVAGCT